MTDEAWYERVMNGVMDLPFRLARLLPWRWARALALVPLMILCLPLLPLVVAPCIFCALAHDVWKEAANGFR